MLEEVFRNRIPQTGQVAWIGLSPSRRSPLESVQQVQAEVGTGLAGDHHAVSGRSKREVTLIQAEHLQVVGQLLGRTEPIDPSQTRRNIVVTGINLLALRNSRFRIGSALLEGTGPCAPCSRMEENLGSGGYQAMRGHGGITAKVLEAGPIQVGDPVTAVEVGPDPDDK